VKLRGRIALVSLAVIVPAVVLTTLLTRRLREQALLEGARALVLDRMESGGRDACERSPARWGRRGPRARPGARGGRRRGGPRRMQFYAYDAGFRPASDRAPNLGGKLEAPLRRGAEVALETVRRRDHGLRRVAVAMPWDDGPCAVILVEQPVPGRALRPVWAAALVPTVVALGVIGLVMVALGPVVARIRRLTRAVQRSASEGWAALTDLPGGQDEVGELARAFDAAARELRGRYEELASRDRALTDFLANTTHDVMIPLSVLQGHLSTVEAAARDGRPPDPAVLERATEEAHYVGALLRNLRVAARLETGAPELSRAPVDLGALVERVVARHAPLARQKGVELDHATPEAPLTVAADEVLVEQAVGNLVHNAIRYNHAGGHTAVVLERRSTGPGAGSRDGFRLRVIDDGPGLTDEELARTQERGYRGNDARTRAPTGLGLGLHIVATVAERHGFVLDFRRPEGGGLEVSLTDLGPVGAEGETAQ